VIVVILVIIAAIVVIALTMTRGPEAASPVGAVGLAAIVLKKVDHFSELNESTYWWTLLTFGVLVLLFVVLAWREKRKGAGDGSAPPAHGPEQRPKTESPLSILFSLAVLIWLVLFVCYRPATKQVETKQVAVKTSYHKLDPISGFTAGFTTFPSGSPSLSDRMGLLLEEVKKLQPKPGDTLLLLGSADCTAVQKPHLTSNQALAKERAQIVADAFPPGEIVDGVEINPESLTQHENCKNSADLRAVFPILIQSQP